MTLCRWPREAGGPERPLEPDRAGVSRYPTIRSAAGAAFPGLHRKKHMQLTAVKLRCVMNARVWVPKSQLHADSEVYKAGTRGSNPANATAMLMRGMAMSLADEQAMKDIIAHINTLSN